MRRAGATSTHAERGGAGRAVLGTLALLGVLVGAFLWIDPFGAPTYEVQVQVLDQTSGIPVAGVRVRGRHDDGWQTVDDSGTARLRALSLPEGVKATTTQIARALEVEDRFATAARELPVVTQDADGVWHAVVRVERFGLLTVSLTASVLPNLKAYLEQPKGVRAVAENGRGVARLGTAATYRIFPGPKRVPVVLKGDMGVAMARWYVRTPSPGSHLQRTYAAIASTNVSGRVVHEGPAPPPRLSGRLTFAPVGWRARLDSDAVEVLGPIDPVRVADDGVFLAPHLSPGAFETTLELDFLGAVAGTEPVTIRATNPELLLTATTSGGWRRVALPPETPRGTVHYEVAREPASTSPARVVHDREASYVVFPELGTWHVQIQVPGTAKRAPLLAKTTVSLKAPGGGALEASFQDVPKGTVVLDVPDAIRTGMRGAIVRVGTAREGTLLANLSREAVFPNIRAGSRTVTVVWRDKAFAPFETQVDVPADGEVRVRVERKARAP